MMSKIKTPPFYAANYLNDEEDVAAYLAVVMEAGDPALLALALGDMPAPGECRNRRQPRGQWQPRGQVATTGSGLAMMHLRDFKT